MRSVERHCRLRGFSRPSSGTGSLPITSHAGSTLSASVLVSGTQPCCGPHCAAVHALVSLQLFKNKEENRHPHWSGLRVGFNGFAFTLRGAGGSAYDTCFVFVGVIAKRVEF